MTLGLLMTLVLAAAPKNEVRIVALGDSTTAGNPFFHSPIEVPPNGQGDGTAPFPHVMEQLKPGWQVFNHGVGGERTDEIRARMPKALALKPKWVVIMAGVNDVYQGRADRDIQQNLVAMYEAVQIAGAVPIAATILPFNASARQSAAIRRMNEWIHVEAKRQKIPFCDTNAAAAKPDKPDELKGSPEGLHPDKATYKAVGQALVKCLEEAMPAPKR